MPRQRPVDRNRKVYTSGLSRSDTALNPTKSPVSSMDARSRNGNFRGVAKPSPSQRYTFQRGMALAVMESLPEREWVPALMEVLAMTGLQDRIMPRWD